jgi:hypothetical protein
MRAPFHTAARYRRGVLRRSGSTGPNQSALTLTGYPTRWHNLMFPEGRPGTTQRKTKRPQGGANPDPGLGLQGLLAAWS